MPDDEELSRRLESTYVRFPVQNSRLLTALHWFLSTVQCRPSCDEVGVFSATPWSATDGQALDDEVLAQRHLEAPLGEWLGEDKTRPAQIDVTDLLRSWGVYFRDGASANYDFPTHTLELTQTALQQKVVDKKLNVLRQAGGPYLAFTTALFEFSDGHPVESRQMDDATFKSWTQEQLAAPSVSTTNYPQVITRDQREVMIQNTRDVAQTGQEAGWEGTQIFAHPVLEGEIIKLSGFAELRRPQTTTALKGLNDAAEKLVSLAVDFEVSIPGGQTALLSLSDSPAGPHFLVALTVGPDVLEGPDSDGAPAKLPTDSRGASHQVRLTPCRAHVCRSNERDARWTGRDAPSGGQDAPPYPRTAKSHGKSVWVPSRFSRHLEPLAICF